MGLRPDPVRRDEVRLVHTYSRRDEEHSYELTTMPLGTYSREILYDCPYLVADQTLWQPALDEIDAQFEARYQAELAQWAELTAGPAAQQDRLTMQAMRELRPKRVHIAKPQIIAGAASEFRCDHCNTRFLGQLPIEFLSQHPQHWRLRPMLCSNQCEEERRKTLQRQWRKSHPLHLLDYRTKRTEHRAEARAGRTCATCGTTIEAARSTRQYCSDRCRIRALRMRLRRAHRTR